MHVHRAAATAIVAVLAVSTLASPLRDQHQAGQLPFLVEQTGHAGPIAGDSLSASYSGLLSLDSFRTLLGPLDFSRLVEHVESLPERRIIALSEHEQDRHIITEGQKALLVFHGIKFIDITEGLVLEDEVSATLGEALSINKDSNDAAFPSNWTYGREELQKKYYDNIDTSRMKSFLQAFSSFRTRYYRSSDGRQSQLFLLEKVRQIINDKKAKHLKMTVEEFPHSWGQNSIIVKLPANDTANAKGTIVVGAHQDSTNLLPFLSAP